MATTTDTVPVGDFEQQTQKFLEWFMSQPGATFHKDIKLVDLRDKSAGRGISKFFFSSSLRRHKI